MAISEATTGPIGEGVDRPVDLRRAPLPTLLALDFRDERRDFWGDEVALWDRLVASWAGLDDAAWQLPGAAPSDGGGPDWSLLEHVGHLGDWLEIAVDYTNVAIATNNWPTDDDFDGDLDRYNETRRERFASLAPAEVRRQLTAARAGLLPIARPLDMATIRSDAAWGWVFTVLHGHYLDHLRVIEPWVAALLPRQAECDPFGRHPQPLPSRLTAGKATFWADESMVTELFRETVLDLPDSAWALADNTSEWTIADHVGHLIAWFEEAAEAITEHRRGEPWRLLPPGGLEEWNTTHVVRRRGTSAAKLRDEFDAARSRLVDLVEAMPDEDWLDPESFSWAYEDLHGHVRAHLAMIGPQAARSGWPDG